MSKLSDRVRAGGEAAPWVIEEIKKLEAKLAVKAGMALVPLRMTQAMRDVTDTEGWAWEDLLAAAEAITEKQHGDLAAAP